MDEQSNNIKTSRDHMLIDSNTRGKTLQNPIANRNKGREKRPAIKPAFPPEIKPKDLILRPEDGSKPPRSPNAFIIYRKIFVETARAGGYHLPMTTVSSMASQSWAKESEEVRSYYKKIAKDAYSYRSELYPKLERRRKRKRWNIVSFQPPSDESKRESSSDAPLSQETPRFSDSNDNQISNQYFISPRLHPETEYLVETPLIPNEFYNIYRLTAPDFQYMQNASYELSPISSDSSPELSTGSGDLLDFNLEPFSHVEQSLPVLYSEFLHTNIHNDYYQPWLQNQMTTNSTSNDIINANDVMTDKGSPITRDPLGFSFGIVTDNNQSESFNI